MQKKEYIIFGVGIILIIGAVVIAAVSPEKRRGSEASPATEYLPGVPPDVRGDDLPLPQEPRRPAEKEPYEQELHEGSYDEGVACTMDAKLCPDGSAVGRIPPDCEFALCPGEEGT